ncbi:MAG: restriction endonuclease subunit S [Balneolaceae bacterium]
MEGLEITILNKVEAFNDLFKARIDPEFYQKHYMALYDLIINKKNQTLGDLAFVTDGEHGNAKTYPIGYSKYYGARNVLDGILNDNNVEFITKEHHKKLRKTALKSRDVLISCVGANIGFAAIVPDTIEVANIVRNVALIRSNTNVKNEYLLAYFLSKFGRNLYIRMNTGNAQPLVSLDYINTVPVYIASEQLQISISELLAKAIYSENQSKIIYSQSEDILLEALDLNNFQPSQKPVNIKSFSESFGGSGRLDAEYYQLKYDEILKRIENYKYGYSTIENEFKLSKKKTDRSKKTYNYTEISDVDVSDGSISYNEVSVDNLPANGKLILKSGHIIISKVRPYRGAVAIIRDTPENYIGSGAFTVLSEKSDYLKEVLQVLLRTKPYQELIMKYNVGSSYPVVKDEDILGLTIPKLDTSKQKNIADLVEESFKLKKKSEHLLEVAKKAVELAIEENEEVAMQFIRKA